MVANSTLFSDEVAFNAAESGNALTDASYYVAPVLNSQGQVVAPISSMQEALIQEAAATSVPTWLVVAGIVTVGWWYMNKNKRGWL